MDDHRLLWLCPLANHLQVQILVDDVVMVGVVGGIIRGCIGDSLVGDILRGLRGVHVPGGELQRSGTGRGSVVLMGWLLLLLLILLGMTIQGARIRHLRLGAMFTRLEGTDIGFEIKGGELGFCFKT